MSLSQYDVIVVGAGAAGLSAAIGLARSGFSVIVVEAAAYPGAENWSGCVYFCENLAHPDLLGPERVETLAWERRLVERGIYASDGYSLLGMTYREGKSQISRIKHQIARTKDQDSRTKSQKSGSSGLEFGSSNMKLPAGGAFRHCYTVLRPIYDHHLAQAALRHGVAILTETTAESLIRDGPRVIGVCTQRGPIYADLVFLAEGDASHLVTREGYERFTNPRETPKFLQGIKQVIDMPEGAIESIFGLGADEGAAYEILLRNGRLRGQDLHLNMGGFIYTNRQSLSVGLVLPLDNLKHHFGGDPNLLLEWFEDLPAFKPWLREGKRGVFGAKLIRGGGVADIPQLVDNGLAIGGAASAIGIDFPYPNFTGPATGMGLLLAQAASKIRAEGGDFSRENLTKHYLEPFQQTNYWKDVEFLRRWPGYVKRTETFFGLNLDLALGTAYVWTRPKRWFPAKWINWLRLLINVAGPAQWKLLRQDARQFIHAARLDEVIDRPAWIQLILGGTINAFRDLFRRPRPNLPPAGAIRVHYSVAGGDEPTGPASRLLQRWFRRFAPILGAAAQRVYSNDNVPLQEKLPEAIRLLVRQINLFDVIIAAMIGLTACFTGALIMGWTRFLMLFGQRRSGRPPRGIYNRYEVAAGRAADLTPSLARSAQAWERRLAGLAYESDKKSHIHLLWPRTLPDKNAVVDQGLWNICPAHVYEARVSAAGQLQVIVNFENCIKCETCWRGSDLVDWGRDGTHRFTYPVHSPTIARLVEAVHATALKPSTPPRAIDPWEVSTRKLVENLKEGPRTLSPEIHSEANQLLDQLDGMLNEFDEALSQEPRTIDRARADYLEMLARYAQQLAVRIQELIQPTPPTDPATATQNSVFGPIAELARALVAKAEERARRTWTQHFSWAAADGRQIRFHHIAGLRYYLNVLTNHRNGNSKSEILGATEGTENTERRTSVSSVDLDSLAFRLQTSEFERLDPWLRTESDAYSVAEKQHEWASRLDAAFPANSWRDREGQIPLTSDQDVLLRGLIAQIPVIDSKVLKGTLHPPERKMLLAELGGRDPSLAFRVASHLWARDLLRLVAPSWMDHLEHWTGGTEWACPAFLNAAKSGATTGNSDDLEMIFIPAVYCRSLLLVIDNQIGIVPAHHAGLSIEPLKTLGLRGAGLARITVQRKDLPSSLVSVDGHLLRQAWSVLSSADLTSIALGMANQLCRRAIAHAAGRVQFPGLFHDEESRDTIGKFGVVKKMLAEMAARRLVIESLDHSLSPSDFSSETCNRAELIKALTAECLGTLPGSITYNAGQIFGGTGYSEDDILSKFYRDAGAWRMLGVPNVETLNRHGKELLLGPRNEGEHRLPRESELFDAVQQRQALRSEFLEIRNARASWHVLLVKWQEKGINGQNSASGRENHKSNAAIVHEALARLDAQLLAGMAILLRTHSRLESGLPADLEIALLRVWLIFVSTSKEEAEAQLRRLTDEPERDDRPFVYSADGRPVLSYANYLTQPSRYDSGDYLIHAIDPAQARLVPELIKVDTSLAECNRQLKKLISDYFGKPRQAKCYERYVESHHRPDAADLDFCREHGFFRMTIPKEDGGEGRPKIDYYLLTTNLQQLADVSLALTVQVNTSIGTTPVFLAYEKDLPKAQKDLDGFLADSNQQKVESELRELTQISASSDFSRIKQGIQEFHKEHAEKVLSRPVMRMLAHDFIEDWSRVRHATSENDSAGLQAHLQKALDDWHQAFGRAKEFGEELVRRREACILFLRWISCGQISAFALTEPSAGSDTARLATRAKLRCVPVQEQSNGTFQFVPFGAAEPRFLIDARRIEFRDRVAHYRWSQNDEPGPFHFDEYDYESDRPDRQRFYECRGGKAYFTDIGLLRRRDDRLWYDYWELTGSKMWITNGRMAGVMCLYARTAEGITGFMVDRHSEGLIVGKDESKMGQCGSPTNELSLQAVRVPRENVIGLEGRGQVNALESLNVGRAGLAMSSLAPMEGLIESCRKFAQDDSGEIQPWIQWRLEKMKEIHFIAEAMAYELVGRFEHSGTGSVRLESAIAKMLTTELLLQVIDQAEEIHELTGQTEQYLVEKRKRDARVLPIYEGTNEIQRFFILKDLATELAPRWKNLTPSPAPRLGREALDLEALKLQFRQRLESALELFGSEIWQNPNLQANCFLLAEMAAWLKGADSTLARLAWLDLWAKEEGEESKIENQESKFGDDGLRVVNQASSIAVSPSSIFDPHILLVGRRALARCFDEVRVRFKRFDEELMHLRRGYYAPEIRAASLLFQDYPRNKEEPLGLRKKSTISTPLSILVVVESTVENFPHPQVLNSRLLEPYQPLSLSSRAAVEVALRIRDQARARVKIEVMAIGPAATAQVLRPILSLGVDRIRLIVPESEPVTPTGSAQAAANVCASNSSFDLILGPDEEANQEDGLLARLFAAALKIPFAGVASQLRVECEIPSPQSGISARSPRALSDHDGILESPGRANEKFVLIDPDLAKGRRKALPTAINVRSGLSLRPFTISGYHANLHRNVEIIRWPKSVPTRKVEMHAGGESPGVQIAAEAELAPRQRTDVRALAVDQAAGLLLKELGLVGAHSASVPYEGTIQDVETPSNLGISRPRVIGVVAADASGRLQPTALATLKGLGRVATACRAEPVTLLLVPDDEKTQRQALGQCLASSRWDVVLLVMKSIDIPEAARDHFLINCWPKLSPGPWAVVAEPWAQGVLASLAFQNPHSDGLALRVRKMEIDQKRLELVTSRARGKLQSRQTLDLRPGVTAWIGLAPEAAIQVGPETQSDQPITVQRWSPAWKRFTQENEIHRLLNEAKEAIGVARLADADFIVDVGFGVGNRDGYEAVIEPLDRALRDIGVQNLVIGGSRKVTEELHLLSADRQIGLSGVSVSPRIILAIGISGAPQHLNYIGPRAVIIAFNRDPEAPIMTLNERQPRPRVFPVVGDLFETVPDFIAALGKDSSKGRP
jgi:alkylation response protein AidB-like acyl-CoA dehydrogenase/flavin-dependent dehydrogenase/electron transfer flavoprotein alpha subunit/ferredoxin-like protein FixX